jgi:hypothetical protein
MRIRWKHAWGLVVVGVAVAISVTLAASARNSATTRGPLKPLNGPLAIGQANAYLSTAPLTRYWGRHPEKAPDELRPAIAQLAQPATAPSGKTPAARTRVGKRTPGVAFNYRFNNETRGYSQDGESLTKCGTGVLGGSNDYHGFLTGNGDGTSYNYSGNGGATLLKTGYLPGVTVNSTYLPSSGDPAAASFDPGTGCVFYAASLAFGPGSTDPSALVLYRSTQATLAGSCSTPATCWPTKKVVASAPDQSLEFLDKEWIAASGTSVMIVYTDFGPSSVTIKAIMCDTALATCGSAMTLDGPVAYSTNDYLQSPYVSFANGKFYVNWVFWDSIGSSPPFYYARIRGRVVTPTSSTGGTLGPLRAVITDPRPILEGTSILIDMSPRVATQAKGAVNANGRWFVVWDRCRHVPSNPFGECDNADVFLIYSNDDGATWSPPINLGSAGLGHEFFPSQPAVSGDDLVVAYYTTAYARAQDGFDSRYDVNAVFSTNANATPPTFTTQRLTTLSSNPFSDWWFLSREFIGDYISAVTDPGEAYIHYNAEYTKLPPGDSDTMLAHQQDNYLAKLTYP